MEIKKKIEKFSPFLQSAMVVLLASLFVATVVYGATTIGANIITAGNATLPMVNATTTNVDTLTTYVGSTLSGLTTVTDLRPAMLHASTTNITSLNVYSVLDSNTSTPTTTVNGIISRNRTTSTSTVTIGDQKQNVKGCLEMIREGAYYACSINSVGTGIACVSGRCN